MFAVFIISFVDALSKPLWANSFIAALIICPCFSNAKLWNLE